MGSRTTSPPSEPSSPADVGARKRVCKACDRCRLKKSKCDGSTPCSRCKADNAICVFGERKKSHDKIYPKGYVEMLEHQQTQLVSGLQELYRRLQTGEGWCGTPLKQTTRGTPLTHDILERLGALRQDTSAGSEEFHDDFNAMQNVLIGRGASFMQREDSFDATSDIDQSPILEPATQYNSPKFTNPFATHFQSSSSASSPHPSFVKTSSPLKSEFNLSQAGFGGSIPWETETAEVDAMDFNMYDAAMMDVHMQALINAQAQVYQNSSVAAINPSMTLKQYPGHDIQTSQMYHGGLYT